MHKLLAVLVCAFFLAPGTVFAYVGPGAGLSLLGALWALILAIGTAIVFVIAWPIRKMRRRKREEAQKAQQRNAQQSDAGGRQAKERAPGRSREAEEGDAAVTPQSTVRQEDADRSRRQ